MHLNHFRAIIFISFAVAAINAEAQDATAVASWDFSTEATTVFDSHGEVSRDQEGPRPPQYPDFQSNNTAIGLGESGGYLSITDPGEKSNFDFTNGDAITLEAWVKLGPSIQASPLYVIGKGRTRNPRFAKDNQNWALRVQPIGDGVRLSFLFATHPSSGDAHWHRWTSTRSFPKESGWHHLAVAYRFGEPDSIGGWIDGISTDGNWDMGGKTIEPPVNDNDDVWIGTANKGNRFVGLLDNVVIHRGLLSDAIMASRFRRVGDDVPAHFADASMPQLDDVPNGQVLVTLSDAAPAADRWLRVGEQWPAESKRWTQDAILLHRLPLRYDDWGIRDAWQGPALLRMAVDVELPPGKHRVLMRARGLGRLWLDHQLIADTKPVTHKSPDGEQPVTPLAQPPLPGHRPHGYRQQEVFAEIDINAPLANDLSDINLEEGREPSGFATPDGSRRSADWKRGRMVLEVIVGGKGQRTEPGELCVAIQLEGSNSFNVITPAEVEPVPLVDDAVNPWIARAEHDMAARDDASRFSAAQSQDEFWAMRHDAATQWATLHPAPVVPELREPTLTPIDAFIAEKADRASAAAESSDPAAVKTFYGDVLPILRDQCFRCHGEKSKGGLKLNTRESALLAGESELLAIVPGDPDASELMEQVRSGAMPPTESGLSDTQIEILENWIRDGAAWPAPPIDEGELAPPPIVSDESFLRRAYLDTVGVPPTLTEAQQFLFDTQPNKRQRLIDNLLDDKRLADHWVSYWQDLLAENPTLLNQSMGSTGPFRWFLYESLRDRKPLDRMITELIMMRGSADTGGSAGFSMSGESDAPMAEKAHILASAFLGVELQCARCHDSPYHSTTQRDLYSLAAMLERREVKVPSTSRVPDAFFAKKGRESLIRVTLLPNESIQPTWPLAGAVDVADDAQLDSLLTNSEDSRERLAMLITAPQNRRFARVMVNRVWKQLMGAGLVEPVNDWGGKTPSHPDLLDWLVHQLISNRYDLCVVMRHIMNSQVYQREATGQNQTAEPEQRFFAAPDRRRLSAEQIVDSLHAATGSEIVTEELTFVHDGQRPLSSRQTLGCPTRAWMFASLNNERDRPSLSLPRARAVVDVLQAFGWNGSRQKPIQSRETDPNVLQPGVLSNGALVMSLTRASVDSELSERAMRATSTESLVDEWFLRILCRPPTDEERQAFKSALAEGFDERFVPQEQIEFADPLPPLPLVTWFNHLRGETNTIQQERERRVNAGPAPDPRLNPHWRMIYEDFIWSLINHRDFVWIP